MEELTWKAAYVFLLLACTYNQNVSSLFSFAPSISEKVAVTCSWSTRIWMEKDSSTLKAVVQILIFFNSLFVDIFIKVLAFWFFILNNDFFSVIYSSLNWPGI